MKPNNAGKDMRLRAPTAIVEWKQCAQTQGAGGMQDITVLYMAQLQTIGL